MSTIRIISLGLTLSLCAGTGQAEGDPARGKALFAQCGFCHSIEAGQNGMGPSLKAVAGRMAGQAPGFNYSAALKGAGLQWTDARLDQWLANPAALVPGNLMMFPGLPDKAARQDLINYLKTL